MWSPAVSSSSAMASVKGASRESSSTSSVSPRWRLEPRVPSNGVLTLREDKPLRIGRLPCNDVVWTKDFVSRRHVELTVERGRAFLVPLTGDATLVRINHAPTTHGDKHELSPGDVVHLVADRHEYVYDVVRLGANRAAKRRRQDLDEASSRGDVVVIEDDETSPPPPPPTKATQQEPPPETNDPSSSSASSRQQANRQAGPDDEVFECVVCSGLLAYTHVLPCGHVACGACLQSWLTRKLECPHCRASVTPGAALAPVHLVDSLVERHARSADPAEAEDWRRRCAQWRRDHPPTSSGSAPPLRAPSAAASDASSSSSSSSSPSGRPPWAPPAVALPAAMRFNARDRAPPGPQQRQQTIPGRDIRFHFMPPPARREGTTHGTGASQWQRRQGRQQERTARNTAASPAASRRRRRDGRSGHGPVIDLADDIIDLAS